MENGSSFINKLLYKHILCMNPAIHKNSPVTILWRKNPSINIHMNMAVLAYSSNTYVALHKIG